MQKKRNKFSNQLHVSFIRNASYEIFPRDTKGLSLWIIYPITLRKSWNILEMENAFENRKPLEQGGAPVKWNRRSLYLWLLIWVQSGHIFYNASLVRETIVFKWEVYFLLENKCIKFYLFYSLTSMVYLSYFMMLYFYFDLL